MAATAGRPSKFTPKVQETILRAISVGSTYELACQSAGIDYSTYAAWMVEAKANPNSKYSDFLEQVRKVEGEAVERLLKLIEKHAGKQWQAAAWKLERRYWKAFSAKVSDLDFEDRLKKLEESKNAKE